AVEDSDASRISFELAVEDSDASRISFELAVEDSDASRISFELPVEDSDAPRISLEHEVEDSDASRNCANLDREASTRKSCARKRMRRGRRCSPDFLEIAPRDCHPRGADDASRHGEVNMQ